MTLHPLIKRVMTQPHLLGEHVHAYAMLFRGEAKKASTSAALRTGLYAGAGALALIGLVLVGVDLLFRAPISAENYSAGWALVVVPLTPFVVATAMVFIAGAKPVEKPFVEVRSRSRRIWISSRK